MTEKGDVSASVDDEKADEKKMWCVEFGCIRVKLEGDDHPYKNYNIFEKIKDVIAKSPLTTEIKWLERKASRFDAFRSDDCLVLDSPLIFKLNLPAKNQKHAQFVKSMFPKKGIITEELYVVYNGFTYLTFSEIDFKGIICSGQDIRDTLKEVIDNDSQISVEIIGPTPFRDEIFIEMGNEDASIDVYKKGILYKASHTENESMFHDVYNDLTLPLIYFYDAVKSDEDVTSLREELSRSINSAMNLLNQSYSLKTYEFIKEAKCNSEICANVRRIYQQLSQLSEEEQYNIIEMERSIKTIQESKLLSPKEDDLIQELSPIDFDTNQIYQTLSFLREEINSRKNNWVYTLVTIIAALIAFFGGIFISGGI